MSIKIRKIDVWQDNEQDWLEYTLEELDEYFNFVNRPDWSQVREIYLHNGGYDVWMDIIFNNYRRTYNNVFGTYVEVEG